MKIEQVMFFSNGNVAVIANNEQVPELQCSLIEMCLTSIAKGGHDLSETQVLIQGYTLEKPFGTWVDEYGNTRCDWGNPTLAKPPSDEQPVPPSEP